MAIALPDARHLSDDALEVFRLRALRGVELGFRKADMADVLGVTRDTVSRWWTAYTSGGVDSLPHERTGRPLGSGRLLSDEQGSRIRSLIDNNTPEQLGVPSALWTRRAVGELIRKEFSVDLAERTVGEYLRRWGYTPKKPRRHARKQDPEEVVQWLEKNYPAIEKQAAKEGAEIHWCDETGVAADHHPGTRYSPKGQQRHPTLADAEVYEKAVPLASTCHELLSPSFRPVCLRRRIVSFFHTGVIALLFSVPFPGLLFDDHEREAAEATRQSIVAPAPRSDAATQKERTRVTADGLPVQSFQCLLADLATLCRTARAGPTPRPNSSASRCRPSSSAASSTSSASLSPDR